MELKLPVLLSTKNRQPARAKTCRCDRPWANFDEKPVQCVRCGHPVSAIIEELIDWALNRAPSDVERLRDEAWRRD